MFLQIEGFPYGGGMPFRRSFMGKYGFSGSISHTFGLFRIHQDIQYVFR
jgi:hypothetical protein